MHVRYELCGCESRVGRGSKPRPATPTSFCPQYQAPYRNQPACTTNISRSKVAQSNITSEWAWSPCAHVPVDMPRVARPQLSKSTRCSCGGPTRFGATFAVVATNWRLCAACHKHFAAGYRDEANANLTACTTCANRRARRRTRLEGCGSRWRRTFRKRDWDGDEYEERCR